MRILMSAAHGGFGSEKVPLGGGAAVFERLCAQWQSISGLDLFTVGAGPKGPDGVHYQQVAAPPQQPSKLGVFAYARFCREFERETTRLALELRPDLVLAHDISEGPNVAALKAVGVPVATIFHVDVVDIFRRLYLGSLMSAQTLAQLYRRFRFLPWPSVLKLVFEKQQQVMESGVLSVVPSRGAGALLGDCYPDPCGPVEVIGWGAPPLLFGQPAVEERALQLRHRFEIPEHHRVLLTLSRLSPEKAQHRLLQAVAIAETQGRMPDDVTVVIAGAPAFMQGQGHSRRLHRLAKKLTTKVVFPGHVGGLDKAAWYRMAHLFVVNSLHESYGLTTLEAMQQSCPVVAVESYGTADTVSVKSGKLVEPGANLPARIWDNIEALMAPATRAQFALGALERSRTLTFEKAAEQLLAALPGH